MLVTTIIVIFVSHTFPANSVCPKDLTCTTSPWMNWMPCNVTDCTRSRQKAICCPDGHQKDWLSFCNISKREIHNYSPCLPINTNSCSPGSRISHTLLTMAVGNTDNSETVTTPVQTWSNSKEQTHRKDNSKMDFTPSLHSVFVHASITYNREFTSNRIKVAVGKTKSEAIKLMHTSLKTKQITASASVKGRKPEDSSSISLSSTKRSTNHDIDTEQQVNIHVHMSEWYEWTLPRDLPVVLIGASLTLALCVSCVVCCGFLYSRCRDDGRKLTKSIGIKVLKKTGITFSDNAVEPLTPQQRGSP